jgi:hypothetical protein
MAVPMPLACVHSNLLEISLAGGSTPRECTEEETHEALAGDSRAFETDHSRIQNGPRGMERGQHQAAIIRKAPAAMGDRGILVQQCLTTLADRECLQIKRVAVISATVHKQHSATVTFLQFKLGRPRFQIRTEASELGQYPQDGAALGR